MTDVVKQLQREHASMARLLRLLADQVESIEQASQPDYPLIEDILMYFLDYPDQCHHPKEDVLAAALLAKDPDRAGRLRGLAAMHHELAGLTRHAAAIVQQVTNEEVVARSDVSRVLREFIGSQRHHMDMEEEYFLPLADDILGPDDLSALNAAVFARADPLEAQATEQRFARLRQQILGSE